MAQQVDTFSEMAAAYIEGAAEAALKGPIILAHQIITDPINTAGGEWLNKMDIFGPSSPFTKQEALQIWSDVSTKMIQKASGQVRSLIGQVRPDSIYRVEQGEILFNSKITGYDELYLKPRFIFSSM